MPNLKSLVKLFPLSLDRLGTPKNQLRKSNHNNNAKPKKGLNLKKKRFISQKCMSLYN